MCHQAPSFTNDGNDYLRLRVKVEDIVGHVIDLRMDDNGTVLADIELCTELMPDPSNAHFHLTSVVNGRNTSDLKASAMICENISFIRVCIDSVTAVVYPASNTDNGLVND